MKCIKGKLIETQYDRPSNDNNNNVEKQMEVKAITELNAGDISYIHDRLGLHRVQNASETEVAMTLHLYIPPYKFCRTYFEQTGRIDKTVQMTFHTIDGKHQSEE